MEGSCLHNSEFTLTREEDWERVLSERSGRYFLSSYGLFCTADKPGPEKLDPQPRPLNK